MASFPAALIQCQAELSFNNKDLAPPCETAPTAPTEPEAEDVVEVVCAGTSVNLHSFNRAVKHDFVQSAGAAFNAWAEHVRVRRTQAIQFDQVQSVTAAFAAWSFANSAAKQRVLPPKQKLPQWRKPALPR